jgi:hypothetical protein
LLLWSGKDRLFVCLGPSYLLCSAQCATGKITQKEELSLIQLMQSRKERERERERRGRKREREQK